MHNFAGRLGLFFLKLFPVMCWLLPILQAAMMDRDFCSTQDEAPWTNFTVENHAIHPKKSVIVLLTQGIAGAV